MCTILYTYLFHYHLDAKIAPGQLDFQFLAQDFQIQEGGSQDFLIQNDSVRTDTKYGSRCRLRPTIDQYKQYYENGNHQNCRRANKIIHFTTAIIGLSKCVNQRTR